MSQLIDPRDWEPQDYCCVMANSCGRILLTKVKHGASLRKRKNIIRKPGYYNYHCIIKECVKNFKKQKYAHIEIEQMKRLEAAIIVK